MITGQYNFLALGLNGSERINDGVEHTGNFCAVHALAATVIDVLVSGKHPGDNTDVMQGDLTSIPLVAGDNYFGYFTSITLASGDVVVYKLKR